MAHSALHFSIGLSAGTVALLPRVISRMKKRFSQQSHMTRSIDANPKHLSRLLATWLITAYTAGTVAVLPSLLCRFGVPEQICRSKWMDIFFLYTTVNRIEEGGMLIGATGLAVSCFLQYLALVTALVLLKRLHRKNSRSV